MPILVPDLALGGDGSGGDEQVGGRSRDAPVPEGHSNPGGAHAHAQIHLEQIQRGEVLGQRLELPFVRRSPENFGGDEREDRDPPGNEGVRNRILSEAVPNGR